MSSILIKNVTLLSPQEKTADILIENERIKKIGGRLPADADKIIDGTGLTASPGLFDMHVHLRDPGFPHKEDLFTGTRAAAAGGFTGVACMPNTNPPADSPEVLKYILDKANQGSCAVYPVACITDGMKGEACCDFAALQKAGAAAVSDDGKPVKNAAVMQRALEQAYALGMPVISHCEDLDIIDGGIMNKGKISARLGVKGMDRTSEDSITAREIALAEGTGTAIHIAHVSTKGSVKILRDAKARGVKVTCETAPHYFLLTDEKLLGKDADYRMNPPLREKEDCEEVLRGILDGTIDAIVTDHAPHAKKEKADFLTAPNGVVGLETSLAACITGLVATKRISLERLIDMMTINPRRILHLPQIRLEEGYPADITLFDPNEKWTVVPEKLHSKSKNTVFKGMTLQGKIKITIAGGKITFEE